MMKLKVFVLACAVALGISAMAEPLADGRNYTEKVGDYTWTFSVANGEATVGVVDEYGNPQWGQRAVEPDPQGALEIPATLGGCPVTAVGYCALYGCGMSSVTLPDMVGDVGQYAFYACYQLGEVQLGNAVTNIEGYAFQSCSALKRISIPASVRTIRDSAFSGCSQLRNLAVDEGNPWYLSDDGVLYDKGGETILFWPRQKKIEIPAGVRDIRSSVFANNNGSANTIVTLPSSVTNIGSSAFASCSLGGIVLNEGLISIGYGAFQYNYLRSIIIPSTVRRMEGSLFYGNNDYKRLKGVFFAGNAPESVDNSLLDGTSADLTVFVREGSTGWETAGSADLPETWPCADWGEQRPIRTWTIYPEVGWPVTFDLGEFGVRTGGGALEQMVAEGTGAVAPEVGSADEGAHVFAGWDREFSNITEATIVRAVYATPGEALIGAVKVSVDTPWAPVANVEYTVAGDVGDRDLVLRLEYLNGGAWQRVPSAAISGEASLEPGQHILRFPIADLGWGGQEITFRLSVRERAASGIEVNNTDGWTIDGGAWRSRSISDGQTTSLFATTFGLTELSFSWKASTESVSYDWLEVLIDGESHGKIGGETEWEDKTVVLHDADEHQIEWRYRKDGSVSGGQDCGWIANVEMGGGASVSETPFAVALSDPEISLAAWLNEDGKVVLKADDPQAKIYLTTNGDVPTSASGKYTGPVDWKTFRTLKAVTLTESGKWSNLIDGREWVKISLNPELGAVDTTAVIRRIGDVYGELPEPTRDGCVFTGWTTHYWSWDWNEWNGGISADSVVPSQDTWLFATWEVPEEMIIDPQGTLESVDYVLDDFGRQCADYGYWDEENDEYVVTNRVWQEYLQVEAIETNVFLSATFTGVGTLTFDWPDYNSFGCNVDGLRQELVARRNRFGTTCSVKILSSEEHLLELTGDTSYRTYYQIGGMVWKPADARVTVEFDPKGGTVGQTSKTYKTGVAYGSFPSMSERPGYEFLGWFTDPVGGEQKTETDFVDFEVQRLYAHWRTSLGTALNNSSLSFGSSGPTGWDGQCGVSHDGIASAASGWLEWNETNVLTTTVSGKGVLNFWWKTENGQGEWGDDDPFGMLLMLEVDGKTVRLREYGEAEKRADGWLRFSYSIVSAGNHTIKWKAAIDSDDPWYTHNGKSVREAKEDWLGELTVEPGVWVDQVEWLPDADQTDVVQWAHSAFQAERILPGSSDPMMAWCNQRIAANPNDYEAHVRRAITRLKVLSENPVFREILAQYGYEFCDDLMTVFGEFNVDNAPLSNDVVDTIAAEVLPTLDDILADLDVIPEDWDGTAALSPDQYPVDETIYIDAADVLMTKAGVHAARAAILAAQGYDLSIDNRKMYEEVVAASNRKSIVVSEFTGDWNDCPVSRMHCFGSDGWFRIASQGAKLLVQLTLPETLPEDCAEAEDVELRLELNRYNEDEYEGYIWLSLDPLTDGANVGNGNWNERIDGEWCSTDLSGTAVSRRNDGRTVELEFDFAAFEQLAGRLPGFEMNEASICWYMPDDELSISTDGDEYDPSLTTEAILTAHPQFGGRIRKPESLASSKTEVRTALDLYEKFDAAVRGRTSGKMHFFEYNPQYAEQWAVVSKQVRLAKESLDGVVTVKGEDFACFGRNFKETNLTERVSLKPFFDGKILRDLLPQFVGNRPALNAIPDITFAGTFPDWTMEHCAGWLQLIDGVWNGTPVDPVDPVGPVVPPVVTNTITYVGLEGAVNTNVTTFTANDLPLTLGPIERAGWRFLGWTPNGGVIPVGTTSDVTFTANWEEIAEPPAPTDPAIVCNVEAEYRTKTDIGVIPVEVVNVGEAVKIAVKGLPSGVKFTAKDVVDRKTKEVTVPANSIYGTPTKSGVYAATVTVTPTDRKSKMAPLVKTLTFVVRNAGEHVVRVDCDAAQGSVKGMGVYASGTKVTLKATAAKGWVFAGWYNGEALVSSLASYALTMPEKDVNLTARFISVAEDKAAIRLAVDGKSFSGDGGETPPPLNVEVRVGMYVEWPVAASALSATTVKVSGLPSGLKFAAKDVKATKTSAAVPANTIYGTPKTASKVDKNGKVTPSKVKITVTTAGKSKQEYILNVTVCGIPAEGTFNGGGENGLVTLTVAKTGKISGKYLADGKTWTLSAAGFDTWDDDDRMTATLTAKSGKELKTLALVYENGYFCASLTSGQETAFPLFEAWRNEWKNEPFKTLAKQLKGRKVQVGEVLLTVGANGAVTAKGTFVTGFDEKKQKDVTYSASCSTVLIPTEHEGRYVVYLYFPPKAGKFAGWTGEVDLYWDGNALVAD